jgi:UDP-glucose 4-epimerase
MDTVLVTGAAGFIGSTLCDRLLAEGKKVVGIDDLSVGKISNLAEARSYDGFTFYNLDIRMPDLQRVVEHHHPEVVMHLAAQASVARSVQDPAHDAGINILGSLNVLQAAAARGVRKVVYAASGSTIYGESRRLPLKETARRGARPISPYGISKATVVDYLHYFKRARGLDYTALALANIYGPRQDPHGEAGMIAIFSQRLLAGETPTIFGDGNQTRDYLFVDDTVDAFARAWASDRASGLLVNVGTGVETSVNRVFELLARITRFRGEPTFGPRREGDLLPSSLDNELAAKQLGWKPWTPLEEGLKAVVDAHRVE